LGVAVFETFPSGNPIETFFATTQSDGSQGKNREKGVGGGALPPPPPRLFPGHLLFKLSSYHSSRIALSKSSNDREDWMKIYVNREIKHKFRKDIT
jgi:hypothetical protein